MRNDFNTQKSSHTPIAHAVVFVIVRPQPPIVELTAGRGVGGWSQSTRASMAKYKATTQTDSWQWMEMQYFSKN